MAASAWAPLKIAKRKGTRIPLSAMEVHIRVNRKTMSEMARAYLPGQMETCLKDSGSRAKAKKKEEGT